MSNSSGIHWCWYKYCSIVRYEGELNVASRERQEMKRTRFHIAVAVSAGIFFLAVTVAHACIGTAASHDAHDHSGFKVRSVLQASHANAQDEACRSVRDRLISSVPQSHQTHSLFGSRHTIPVIGEQLVTEHQTLTAERPPGANSIADDQPPLYIFNSVFRI